MSVWLEWEVPQPALAKDWEALAQSVIAQSLSEENVTVPTEVSVTITGAEEIRELNRDYREIDSVTDVLSFPQWDYEGATVQEVLETAEKDPETDEVCLGDIVICLDRAREQAEEYGHSIERELGFLVAHSMLHLLGYDHMVPEEEKVMMDKQEKILQALNLTR